MALTGNEIVQVLGSVGGAPAATTQGIPINQIAQLAGLVGGGSPTSVTTNVGATLTAAQLSTGLLNRTGPTAVYTDTLDTAANLYAAAGSNVANSILVRIKNATAFLQTLTGGTGVTIATALIPPISIATYIVTFASATAATFNHVSTTVMVNVTDTLYSALANTAGFTLTAATSEAGARDCTILLSGTLGAGANVQSDTAAAIVAAIPNARAGMSYRLRIINASSANFAWTLTTNTNVTLTGTMTIAQNTWRDFYVTLTSLTAVAIQAIGTGTNS